jgi:hypothetical protein
MISGKATFLLTVGLIIVWCVAGPVCVASAQAEKSAAKEKKLVKELKCGSPQSNRVIQHSLLHNPSRPVV